MENLVEVQPPGSNRLFVVLGVIPSGDRIPFTPFDNVHSDLVHSPDWELSKELTRRTHRRFDSRRQFLNCFKDGLTELIRPSFVHPPIEGFADASAG